MLWVLAGMVVVWAAVLGYVLLRMRRSHAIRKAALRRQTQAALAALDDLKRTADDLSDTVRDYTQPSNQ